MFCFGLQSIARYTCNISLSLSHEAKQARHTCDIRRSFTLRRNKHATTAIRVSIA